ncbi:DUF6765 family protein, partial [Vibrio parahaemolyticus]|uniref:DUF6765 family protein n=1 Tax=Vibrio parahaemolyticus TaxID=670 RepID=UPI002AC89E85
MDIILSLTLLLGMRGGGGNQHAKKVAYSAQYVEGPTNYHPIHFDNGEMYDRIVSAHKMLNYRNTQKLANHKEWIPFHFFPGN